MFDTTNQTETTLNTADENNYEEIFDSLEKEEENNTCNCNDEEDVFADFGKDERDNQTREDESGRYRVVYNGKEMFLDLEELKTNAQKGLNYDHVKNEYDILRAQPGARELLRDARQSGLSSKAYLSQQKLRDKRSRVEDLMGRGIGEREALYVTDLEDKLEGERLLAEKKKPFYDFAKAYPNVLPEDIPDEVWHKFHNGTDLCTAYALYENEKLKREVMMQKQNENASLRSVGSAISSAAQNVPDSFLEGLFG
ncbi:MAG: hypothetical protein E7410_00885 [Ruminococcaceae bacterium]|nr:hypothetical protein [Oscillospiraceae bacterium]